MYTLNLVKHLLPLFLMSCPDKCPSNICVLEIMECANSLQEYLNKNINFVLKNNNNTGITDKLKLGTNNLLSLHILPLTNNNNFIQLITSKPYTGETTNIDWYLIFESSIYNTQTVDISLIPSDDMNPESTVKWFITDSGYLIGEQHGNNYLYIMGTDNKNIVGCRADGLYNIKNFNATQFDIIYL